MTDNTIPQSVSKNQVYKQAGLFAEDGEVVLLTEKEKKAICNKAYRELNYGKVNIQRKSYRSANSDKLKERSKAWCDNNPEKKKAADKKYRSANLEKVKAYQETYRAANLDNEKIRSKTYRKLNKDKINTKLKTYRFVNPDKTRGYNFRNVKYEAYKDKLQIYEKISQDSNGKLIVVCAYCGKLYAPTKAQVSGRICAINGSISGEHRFYCSKLCKTSCPTYKQVKYYRFQKIGYTREVPTEFRHMALLDRNYTCENCGSDESGLHVHHINGYTESPMEMADLSNIKVLCASCHKAIHSTPGCHFVDYSCKNQKQ